MHAYIRLGFVLVDYDRKLLSPPLPVYLYYITTVLLIILILIIINNIFIIGTTFTLHTTRASASLQYVLSLLLQDLLLAGGG